VELAAENYRKAIELDPSVPDYYVNYGNIFYLKGSWNEAEKLYRKSLAINPESLLAKKNLGLLYVQTGKNDLALELFRDVLRSGPADPALEKMIKNLTR
jgi:tetratricopeptide (TPR) repeat protein